MRIQSIDNAPKKLLVDRVRAVLYWESAKPFDEMNSGLVAECSEFLMEAENVKKITASETEAHLSAILGRPIKLRKRRVSAKALIVAACLVVILLLASVATVAFDSDPDSIIQQFAYRLSEMLGGESVEYMGIEIIKNPEASKEQWLSLEEFLAQNNEAVLYPSEMPDSIYITQVRWGKMFDSKSKDYTEYNQITYITNDVNAMSVTAVNDPSLAENILSNEALTVETVNGFDCYILADTGFAQANIIYKDYVYTISTTNYEVLIEIINGLKENE